MPSPEDSSLFFAVETGEFFKATMPRIPHVALQKRIDSPHEHISAWLGESKATGAKVLVKVLDGMEAARNPAAAGRFSREAKLASMIDHPNVLRVLDHGSADGVRFIVFEHFGGMTVADLLAKGPLSLEWSTRICWETASALTEAARVGITHRDVRPENLLVTQEREIKLVDLGLAKKTEGETSASMAGITQAGEMVGTPYYMSPEHIMDNRQVDIRSDIYSLGATYFHMLAGHVPFEGAAMFQVVARHMRDPVPSVAALRNDCPPEVDAIISKMMAKQPAHRYQTPDELMTALEQLGDMLGFSPSAARPRSAGAGGTSFGQSQPLPKVGDSKDRLGDSKAGRKPGSSGLTRNKPSSDGTTPASPPPENGEPATRRTWTKLPKLTPRPDALRPDGQLPAENQPAKPSGSPKSADSVRPGMARPGSKSNMPAVGKPSLSKPAARPDPSGKLLTPPPAMPPSGSRPPPQVPDDDDFPEPSLPTRAPTPLPPPLEIDPFANVRAIDQDLIRSMPTRPTYPKRTNTTFIAVLLSSGAALIVVGVGVTLYLLL